MTVDKLKWHSAYNDVLYVTVDGSPHGEHLATVWTGGEPILWKAAGKEGSAKTWQEAVKACEFALGRAA